MGHARICGSRGWVTARGHPSYGSREKTVLLGPQNIRFGVCYASMSLQEARDAQDQQPEEPMMINPKQEEPVGQAAGRGRRRLVHPYPSVRKLPESKAKRPAKANPPSIPSPGRPCR